MSNKTIWCLYGLPNNKVEVYTSFKVLENDVAIKYGLDTKHEKTPGTWVFSHGNKKLVAKRQELIGSNDLLK